VITLDRSRWPLLIYTARGEQTEADFDAYLAAQEEVLQRNERFAAIFDARNVNPGDIKWVGKNAKWIERHARELKRLNIGITFLTPSPTIRGVLRATLWMFPLPQPFTVCDSMPVCIDWITRRLRESGMPVPNLKGLD
jgi:hypothetical protein